MRRLTLFVGILCFSLPASAQHYMTLQEMFAAADSLNATLNAADFGIKEADAGVEVAKNAYLPSIQASANVGWIGLGYSMDRNFANAVDEKLPGFGNNISLQVSQVVFAGGAIKNGVKAADIGSRLAKVQASSDRNEVRYLIAGTSLEVLKLQNQLQAVQSNIELVGKVLEQMNVRYDEGTVLKSDISRYELMLQNLEYAKVDIEGTVRIMSSRLATAIGMEASEQVIPLMEISIPPRGENFDASQAPAIQGASLAAQLSETQVAIAKSERIPGIALFAGDTFNGPDVTTFISGKMAGLGSLDKNFNFATVGIGITYNLDNLYKSGKKIRQTEAALGKARSELDAARQGIDLALTAARTEYTNSFTKMNISEQALDLAETSYTQVSDRYAGGLATITDLLDASSKKLESEIAAINAKADVMAAYYKLLYICATL